MSCGPITTRERPSGRAARLRWLSSELPGSYSVWHEPCVDGRKPDLVLFGPQIGLMVLEVKDWSRDAILEVDGSGRVGVRHSDGEKLETHPIVQARDAVYVVANRLEKEAPCRQNTGAHEGKLAFPWNVGAIFPNLTRNEAVELGLERGHPEGSIITGDDIGGRLAWALAGDKVAKRARIPLRHTLLVAERRREACRDRSHARAPDGDRRELCRARA